jgi:hypothetical protein
MLMADRRRSLFSNELEVGKPREIKGASQVVIAIVCDCKRHRLPTYWRRLETPRPPAGINVESMNWCRPHDRGKIRRHVAQAAPLAEHLDVTQKGKQIKQMPRVSLCEFERRSH